MRFREPKTGVRQFEGDEQMKDPAMEDWPKTKCKTCKKLFPKTKHDVCNDCRETITKAYQVIQPVRPPDYGNPIGESSIEV